jgi:cell surface protein SprA
MISHKTFSNDSIKVTSPSSNAQANCSPLSAESVWPEDNNIDLSLALLTQLKIMAMGIDLSTLPLDGIYYQNEDQLDPASSNKVNKLRLGIKGNPNFGFVRTLMVGVKARLLLKISKEKFGLMNFVGRYGQQRWYGSGVEY